MSNYVYDASKDSDIKKLKKELLEISGLFNSKKFKNFIADKCLFELALFTQDMGSFSRGEEHSVFLKKVEEYKRNNKKEIGDDYIIIFNETTLEQSEMYWVSEKTIQNYPNGISIAYIIEYGTGLLGTSQEDWQVNVNNHNGSWSYKKDEKIYHTSGISGRFIYQKLLERVKLKFEKWTDEFLEKEVDW